MESYEVYLCYSPGSQAYEVELFVYDLYTFLTHRGRLKVFFQKLSAPNGSMEKCAMAAKNAKVLLAICDDQFPSRNNCIEIASALSNNVVVQPMYVSDRFRWEQVGKEAWRMKDLDIAPTWLRGIDAFREQTFALPPIEFSRSPTFAKKSYDHLLFVINDAINYASSSDDGASSSQCTFTPHDSGALMVAGGHAHSLVVLKNGTVRGFGWDHYKQVSGAEGTKGIKQISCGLNHSLLVLEDGSVVGCGDNQDGQISKLDTLSGVKQVAVGRGFSLFLLEDGTVVGRGSDKLGQVSGAQGVRGVRSIVAGGSHSLLLLEDNTVVGFGLDRDGQVSGASKLRGVKQMSAGRFHSLFLLEDGTAVGCGLDNEGQVSKVAEMSRGGDIVQVAAGGFHSLLLTKSGQVLGCGFDEDRQVSDALKVTGATQVACGGFHSLFLHGDGTISGCGKDEFGQISDCNSSEM